MAPRLAYFEYIPDNKRYSEPTVFTELGPKFSSVSHLVLRCTHLKIKQGPLSSTSRCTTHGTARGWANTVFESTLPSSAWQHLEYLSINSGEDYYENRTDQVHRRIFLGVWQIGSSCDEIQANQYCESRYPLSAGMKLGFQICTTRCMGYVCWSGQIMHSKYPLDFPVSQPLLGK